MTKKKIDLEVLPQYLQYFISSTLVVAVITVAWFIGQKKSIPDWIENYLIPGLSWLGLGLILLVVIDWLKNIFGSLRNDQPRETTQQSSADNTDTSD